MKNTRRFLYVISCVFILLFSFDLSYAKEESKPDGEQKDVISDNSGCAGYIKEEDRKACIEDRQAIISSSPFITKAILSLDSDIAEKELNRDYIKYFENSTTTAMAYGISLFDPETILMAVINFATTILEKIGQLITFIVMLIYNVASGSFIETILRGVFEIIEKALFDWSNPNSYVYRLIIVFGMFAIVYKVMQNTKVTLSIKSFLDTVVKVVISCAMIVFVGMYGRPLVTNMENLLKDGLSETFTLGNDDKVPLEIHNKEMLFENLQLKAFRLRHFGVTEVNQIEKVEGVTNKERYEALIKNPSVAQAKAERMMGNTEISYNTGSCFKVFGVSLIFLVHRGILGLIFGAASMMMILIVFFKEVLLGVSVYALLFSLFQRSKSAFSWFANRLQWSMISVVSGIIFSVFLYAINVLVAQAMAFGGILMMIPLDIAIVIMGIYAFKKFPEWMERLMYSLDVEGKGAFATVQQLVVGHMDPQNMIDRFKEYGKDSEKSEKSDSTDSEDETDHSLDVKSFEDPDLFDVSEPLPPELESEKVSNELSEIDKENITEDNSSIHAGLNIHTKETSFENHSDVCKESKTPEIKEYGITENTTEQKVETESITASEKPSVEENKEYEEKGVSSDKQAQNEEITVSEEDIVQDTTDDIEIQNTDENQLDDLTEEMDPKYFDVGDEQKEGIEIPEEIQEDTLENSEIEIEDELDFETAEPEMDQPDEENEESFTNPTFEKTKDINNEMLEKNIEENNSKVEQEETDTKTGTEITVNNDDELIENKSSDKLENTFENVNQEDLEDEEEMLDDYFYDLEEIEDEKTYY